MRRSTIEYKTSGGLAEALFVDPGTEGPGVLVLHEIWGMTPMIEEVCARLAEMGYASFAPNLYWRDMDLFSADNIDQAMRTVWTLPLAGRFDSKRLGSAIARSRPPAEAARLLRKLYDRRYRSIMSADVEGLAKKVRTLNPAVGAIGYSMGGGIALKLAAGFRPLRACATFSGEPPTADILAKIRAPILCLYGSEDSFMTRRLPGFVSDALELGKRVTLEVYPSAGHEFFDRSHKKFEPRAAQQSWRALTEFLGKHLGDQGGANSPQTGGRKLKLAP